MSGQERTGRVGSGDVELFYRLFGTAGKTPIVILHSANYFDSSDMVEIAAELAGDREVAAFDARGFGQSGWSANKDYSHSANVSDVVALLDGLGWQEAVVLGVSRGAAFGLLVAARFTDRVRALILVDYLPMIGIGHPGTPLTTEQQIGVPPRVHPTVEDAVASTMRRGDISPGSPGRARAEEFLEEVDGGYQIATRDPDFRNLVPLEQGDWPTEVPIDVDQWAELGKVDAPVLRIVLSSPGAPYDPQSVERLERDLPQITTAEVDAAHDIAATGVAGLVGTVKQFLTEIEA